MAEREKSAGDVSGTSSKKSKASVTGAVSKLTVRALQEFRLSDENNPVTGDDTAEGAGEFLSFE